MIIEDIANYIEDNTDSVQETDLFIGELPFDKSDCVALVYSPSPEPNKALHYYTQMIDIRARFGSFEDGYAKLLEIFRLFHRAENYETDNFHIYLSYASGMPMDNDRDVERRHLLQLSLGFIYRELVEPSS